MSQAPAPSQPGTGAAAPGGRPRGRGRLGGLSLEQLLREVAGQSAVVSVLAVVLATFIGSLLVVVTDPDVQQAVRDPGNLLPAVLDSIGGACTALFQGAVFNGRREGWENQLKPLTETLTFATPLIAAGLGVAVAFRVGLFNIGGRGQILVAASVAGWLSWTLPLPVGVHLVVCLVGAVVGGALWGGLAGLLKARTGAHEVIVTIMLNYVAFYLVSYLLRTPGALQEPGSNNPQSPPARESALLPTLSDLLGTGAFRLHLGFVLAVVATFGVAHLIDRSSLGFRFRAVGENPRAARAAGIDVPLVYVTAMVISGGLVGLAASSQVLGTTTTGFSAGIEAGIGFEAITVALLGRSRPWGVLASGILFGALKAGGYSMQASQDIPIDIVLVVQSIIVLFLAAPPLVRSVFRLPTPAAVERSRWLRRGEEVGSR